MKSIDILFSSVPYTDTQEPVMAPGYLKAIAQEAGFKSMALDLNIDIVNKTQTHPKSDAIIEAYFQESPMIPEIADIFVEHIDYVVDQLLKHNPKIIGLSLLTHNCQRFTRWLVVRLRQLSPETRILLGGSGIKDFVASRKNDYCETLKTLGLIDDYIIGDAEQALIEYLKGNLTYPGINNDVWDQPTDLSIFPFPDYSDYNFSNYASPVIPIVDSQGCVRACEFCDVIEHWKKYTYKSADLAFKEMLYQSNRHNIYEFSMRNSLTNGNMREFRRWVDLIAEHNQTAVTKFSWSGFFIVREANQHPEELWEKIGLSNGHLLLGVESVIERVRWELGKKFTNAAIDWHLDMAQKYQVPVTLLMITGSPSETRQDYEFTQQWFKDRISYAGNSVRAVQLNQASILPGTEWYRKTEENKIDLGQYPVIWLNRNIRITQHERVTYWKELVEICRPFNTTFDAQPDRVTKSTLTVLDEFL